VKSEKRVTATLQPGKIATLNPLVFFVCNPQLELFAVVLLGKGWNVGRSRHAKLKSVVISTTARVSPDRSVERRRTLYVYAVAETELGWLAVKTLSRRKHCRRCQ